MVSFSISEKKLSSVIQLEIDAKMLERSVTFETPVRKFDGLDGIEWSVACNTRASAQSARFMYPVYTTCVTLKVKTNDNGRDFQHTVKAKDANGFGQEYGLDVEHTDLKSCVIDGKIVLEVTISCYITDFRETGAGICKLQLQPFEIVERGDKSFDLEMIVGKCDPIMMHKGFLSTMSPVFNAMFTHDTKEARTGVIEIKDFDHATVKCAINLLYGHLFESKSPQDVLELLRFAEKYIIKAVVIRLEAWLGENITVDNFNVISQHAWDHSNDKLKEVCARFYRQQLKPELRDVNPNIVADMAQLSLS